MKSKITGGETTFLFKADILNKYTVDYYRCNDTGFIQTETPYWLDEAYSSAITLLDVGLAMRNNKNVEIAAKMIDGHFNFAGKFLDLAGGYGLFTRLMRDKGFDFYHSDVYCQNLFANHFTLEGIKVPPKFELLTIFETFEHFNNPVEEIGNLFKYSDNILFSTEIIPDSTIKKASDWWYFVPEIGQHIAFYTVDTLQYIAKKNNTNLYTNGTSMHLFSKKQFNANPFQQSRMNDSFIVRQLKRTIGYLERGKRPLHPSLLQSDVEYIKSTIPKSNP